MLGVRSFCSSKLSTKFVKSVGRQYSSFGGSNGAKGVAAWSNTNTNSNRARTGAGFGLSLFLGSVLLTTTAVCDAKNDPKTKVYRRSEVKKHTTPEKGIWVTRDNGVYDVTEFVANHPGGTERLMLAAGKDLSEFWTQPQFRLHYQSPLAFELLEEMRIGTLHPDDVVKVDVKALTKQPLKYPTNRIYDCIVVGAGISGLQCATNLTRKHNVPTENILVLEAQDYVGGRVRQMSDFVKGVHIDVGAEFLHGSNTYLTRFAEENKEPITEIYCWAHGDGGPLQEPVDKHYGLYYIQDPSKDPAKARLLRYDDKDPDFVRMNEMLWDLSNLDTSKYSDDVSLADYLATKGFSKEMLAMAAGGFSNTLCTNSRDLSLKQAAKWVHLWDEGEGQDGDFNFVHSFKCLVDALKKNIQIETSSPVTYIQYPTAEDDLLDGLIKVRTERGDTYYARTIVISSSPYVLRSEKMTFNPPLSTEIKSALNTINMHSIVKVFLKFSRPAWPKELAGMIMTDESFLIPEIWFRDVTGQGDKDEPANAYAVGFTTADYAARLAALPKAEVLKMAVKQLDTIFAKLEPRHMAADPNAKGVERPSDIPKPSEVYLGGMFWDWNPNHHPYIGGGYCSPKAKTAAHTISILSKPYAGNIHFCGEATNLPGATAHAALESGYRAANQVSTRLQEKQQVEA
jgi:monoamine oxidase